jgi:hypothetical protein
MLKMKNKLNFFSSFAHLRKAQQKESKRRNIREAFLCFTPRKKGGKGKTIFNNLLWKHEAV